MGLRCVAVYSEAGANSSFVTAADVAVHVPGYLESEAIIAAAVETGADAIHPRYGFLSENADFARAVIDAGLIWIGPSPEVIESMGDKIAAKKAAVDANVPILLLLTTRLLVMKLVILCSLKQQQVVAGKECMSLKHLETYQRLSHRLNEKR